ncbi:TetR/AcrR family transcriptional regulator [Pseudonocardia cypriaca]|uniref:TetR family transcriptional regulator n=1 Tax=Pseudonocardia cypriaca TaxID=882449 RepID=A0A543FX68_9PSEU|nr:TetR/AcrR family transcriptional regulator [Pseudonocardia cypriaca]TQM38432.1 TetR family transcriptional regulator [Pseudonocardia cypriaca]
MDERPADPRTRAARTKRVRTRAALIAAADSAFSRRGWAATRIEDIADAAGVSSATAYNHFPTKHALLGAVYEPHVRGLIRQAEADIAAGRPVVGALVEQINALARLSWYHRGLTASFTAAVLDYTIRTGKAPDPEDQADPRVLAPINMALLLLIQHGQANGELRSHPPASEISGMVVNLLLVRSINREDEPPAVTADLMLTLLFGALRPELVIARDGAGSPWG